MDTSSSFRFEEAGVDPTPGAGLGRPTHAAVIVAHPDDETLWAGGLILTRPNWRWHVVTLCRRSDPDRAAKFARAMEALGATGTMGDLDDGPEQRPLLAVKVEQAILALLPEMRFDVLLTHGPRGEYTRHRRHEETHVATVRLLDAGAIRARELWTFAYEDGGGEYLPRADPEADRTIVLPDETWRMKRHIITDVYGFGPDSFEARTVPRTEAFRVRACARPAKGSGRPFGEVSNRDQSRSEPPAERAKR